MVSKKIRSENNLIFEYDGTFTRIFLPLKGNMYFPGLRCLYRNPGTVTGLNQITYLHSLSDVLLQLFYLLEC